MEDLDLQSKAEAFSEEADNWWANLDDGERLEIYFEKNPTCDNCKQFKHQHWKEQNCIIDNQVVMGEQFRNTKQRGTKK